MSVTLGQNTDDRQKIISALDDIQTSLTVVEQDLALIDTATQIQVRDAVKHLLLIERAGLRRERAVLRQLAKLLAKG